MPLETINYISDLNAANPAVSDGLVQGDDHLRGIKAALKNTFPNFTGAAVSTSEAQLNAISALLTVSHGQLRGPGLPACGAYVDFPLAPLVRFTSAGVVAGGQAAVDHVEADGSLYNITDFPDLGALLGNRYGGNGTTTFAVPNLKDTGRFRRSRTASLGVGTAQANQFGSHTHTGTSDVGGVDHTHALTISGTTSGQSADHSHINNVIPNYGGPNNAGGPFAAAPGNGGLSTAGTSNDHTHTFAFAGNSGTASAVLHTHTFTTNPTGSSETRPESIVVVVGIKT